MREKKKEKRPKNSSGFHSGKNSSTRNLPTRGSHWVSGARAICLAVGLEERVRWVPCLWGRVAARVPSAVRQKPIFMHPSSAS